MVALILSFGLAIGAIGNQLGNTGQPSIKRKEVLRVDLAGAEGAEAHMWVAEIEPGAKTEKHIHPTPRFVYVMAGSVIVEIDGKPTQTYKTGDGFQSMPDVVHVFRNASSTHPAKALGFQIAQVGQPLLLPAAPKL